jgi:maleylacetate reductase
MGLVFDHRTPAQRVLFGSGRAVEHVVAVVRADGAKRVQLIAARSAAHIADGIAAEVPVVHRIDDPAQHVPAESARSAARAARDAGVDLIVTIGGGSATGLGKMVAGETGVPIVAVPTTFAGSEATDVWGKTEHGEKKTGTDPRVLPRTIVYDAELTVDLPARLAAASGLNAIAHAVDGLWAPRADPINAALGVEGLRTLVPALRALNADGADLRAREQVLVGAYLSALAFASAGAGLHHRICHVLGGAFALPHAETHAVVLPRVVAFNAPAAPEATQRLSAVFGGTPPAVALAQLSEELGAPSSLAELGMHEADVEKAADLVLPEVPPSNPRPVDRDGLITVLRSAWAGDSIER